MIDLHCHLLPGIDDGAETLEEAVAMCRRAAEDGCETLVATPHQRHPRWWNTDARDLEQRLRRLREAVGPRPHLYLGAEIRVDSAFLDDLEKGTQNGGLPLAGTRTLLVEFPRQPVGPDPEEIVHELVVAGWRPLLAHPELLPWLAPELDKLARLVEVGAALQLTAMSLTGGFGRRPLEAARTLVHEGLAHVVASDCHGIRTRPPGLSAARQEIERRWSPETAQRLTYRNPQAIVADQPLES